MLTFVLGLDPEAPLMVAGTLRDDDIRPRAGRVGRPDGGDWTAHRDHAGAAARRRRPRSSLRRSPAGSMTRGRRGAAVRGDGRLPALRRRGRASHGRSARAAVPGRRPRRRAARAARAGDTGGPRGRRPGGRGRGHVTLDLLTEASDLDGGKRGPGRRRAVAAADPARVRATATSSRTTCFGTPRTRWSARRGGGCCTGASRRASSYSMRMTPTRSRPSSRSSTPAAGAQSGRWRTTGGQRRSQRERFAHVEAIRLHSAALDAVSSMPEAGPGTRHELAILEAMGAPLNAEYGYASRELQRVVERSLALAESLGRRDSTQRALVALWTSRQVQGRIADGYRVAARALWRMVDPDSRAERTGAFRRCRRRLQPRDARRRRAPLPARSHAAPATGTR